MRKFIAWSLCGAAAALLLLSACTAAQPAPASTKDTAKSANQPVNASPAISDNESPVVSDIVGPQVSAPRTDVQLTCRVKEYPGGALKYTWSVDGGTIRDEGKQATSFAPFQTDKKDEDGNPMVGFNTSENVPVGSIVTWTTPDNVGTYTVTVKVSGSGGGESAFHKSFSVVDPSTSATTVSGVPSSDTTINLQFDMSSGGVVKESRQVVVMHPQSIHCEVIGQDLSGLTFKWSAPFGGKLIGDGLAEGKANAVGWLTPGVAGQYSVNVVITDKSGHKISGQVDFDVLAM